VRRLFKGSADHFSILDETQRSDGLIVDILILR
jgi:hypothetical protein